MGSRSSPLPSPGIHDDPPVEPKRRHPVADALLGPRNDGSDRFPKTIERRSFVAGDGGQVVVDLRHGATSYPNPEWKRTSAPLKTAASRVAGYGASRGGPQPSASSSRATACAGSLHVAGRRLLQPFADSLGESLGPHDLRVLAEAKDPRIELPAQPHLEDDADAAIVELRCPLRWVATC